MFKKIQQLICGRFFLLLIFIVSCNAKTTIPNVDFSNTKTSSSSSITCVERHLAMGFLDDSGTAVSSLSVENGTSVNFAIEIENTSVLHNPTDNINIKIFDLNSMVNPTLSSLGVTFNLLKTTFSDSCLRNTGLTLAPGDKCKYYLKFSPTKLAASNMSFEFRLFADCEAALGSIITDFNVTDPIPATPVGVRIEEFTFSSNDSYPLQFCIKLNQQIPADLSGVNTERLKLNINRSWDLLGVYQGRFTSANYNLLVNRGRGLNLLPSLFNSGSPIDPTNPDPSSYLFPPVLDFVQNESHLFFEEVVDGGGASLTPPRYCLKIPAEEIDPQQLKNLITSQATFNLQVDLYEQDSFGKQLLTSVLNIKQPGGDYKINKKLGFLAAQSSGIVAPQSFYPLLNASSNNVSQISGYIDPSTGIAHVSGLVAPYDNSAAIGPTNPLLQIPVGEIQPLSVSDVWVDLQMTENDSFCLRSQLGIVKCYYVSNIDGSLKAVASSAFTPPPPSGENWVDAKFFETGGSSGYYLDACYLSNNHSLICKNLAFQGTYLAPIESVTDITVPTPINAGGGDYWKNIFSLSGLGLAVVSNEGEFRFLTAVTTASQGWPFYSQIETEINTNINIPGSFVIGKVFADFTRSLYFLDATGRQIKRLFSELIFANTYVLHTEDRTSELTLNPSDQPPVTNGFKIDEVVPMGIYQVSGAKDDGFCYLYRTCTSGSCTVPSAAPISDSDLASFDTVYCAGNFLSGPNFYDPTLSLNGTLTPLADFFINAPPFPSYISGIRSYNHLFKVGFYGLCAAAGSSMDCSGGRIAGTSRVYTPFSDVLAFPPTVIVNP